MNTHATVHPVEIKWGHGTDAVPSDVRPELEQGFHAIIRTDPKLEATAKVSVYRSKSPLPTRDALPEERFLVAFMSDSGEMLTPTEGLRYVYRGDDGWRIENASPPKASSPTKSRRG